jgi:ATPase family associated with various cellular activities (AAA)
MTAARASLPGGVQPAPDEERDRVALALEGKLLPPPEAGRLSELATRFGLGPLERDCIAALWAGALDPAMHAAITMRDQVQAQLTVLVVAEMFGHVRRPRLASGSPLLAWEMVREHELVSGGAALTLDPTIIAWLEGEHELDRAFAAQSQILALGPELPDWPVDPVAARIHSRLRAGGKARLRVRTRDGLAARWFAASVGQRLGLPVLDLGPCPEGQRGQIGVRFHRQCFLDNCIPFMRTADAVLSAPPGISPFPVQIVHVDDHRLPSSPDMLEIEAVLETPGPDERARLWRRFLPASATWPPDELDDLALCHEAEAGEIAAIADQDPADARQAAAALRELNRDVSGPLARRVDAAFTWHDLVVAPVVRERLDEFAFEARERVRLWSEPQAARLFPYGRGLVGLFAGPPGTGKTMAAQVIAGGLGLDLMSVDLSAVISKWVGETAQHLQELLSSKAISRSVLFFDEADALYAKRVEEVRDAQDRFANFDSSHLMAAIETYPGIVILATNLRANIDSAFLRRIRHIVDFSKPGPVEREAIWARTISGLFPKRQAKSLSAKLALIAPIEASGAVIKNAALSAFFASRRQASTPTIRLLGESLARELSKEGVVLPARELDALLEGGA